MLAFLSSHLILDSDTDVCHFLKVKRNHAKDERGLQHDRAESHSYAPHRQFRRPVRSYGLTQQTCWNPELLKKVISGRKLILPLLKKAEQGKATSFLQTESVNFDN